MTVGEFLARNSEDVAKDILYNQPGTRPEQLVAWTEQASCLSRALSEAQSQIPSVTDWRLLFEYQLLRLQRRIDLVLIADDLVFCIEFKIGADKYDAIDRRQAENYAIDLRDFHSGSRGQIIIPILCATTAKAVPAPRYGGVQLQPLTLANESTLGSGIVSAWSALHSPTRTLLDADAWNIASYRPIPTIIEAAQAVYGAHTVMDIKEYLAEHEDLDATASKIIGIIKWAASERKHVLCFVTGVPGSGKTLVGLRAIHDPRLQQKSGESGAFLSGNSPLVEVLREALARDRRDREGTRITKAREESRTAIQHLMDFLREYLQRDMENPPHEHVIVFDEAQRAWDADYGKKKFGREASEPELVLSTMARHHDWSVVVALVGGGQEINKGEGGLSLWGEAVASLNQQPEQQWEVVTSHHALDGTSVTSGDRIFASRDRPATIHIDDELHLPVSIRSHRSEMMNEWIECVLEGDRFGARRKAAELEGLKVYIARSLDEMKAWLWGYSTGYRRCGLLASSGARRLQAYGLGLSVGATDLDATKHWFLAPRGDVRSSYSLEVVANEYGCQGLELDNCGLCWGGDLTWSDSGEWRYRRFSGSKWTQVRGEEARSNILNTYRVLMSRARDSLVIWVPPGDERDSTRSPETMDATAKYLESCGARALPEIPEQIDLWQSDIE